MRLLYDYQCFTQPNGGVSRYFYELTRHIPDVAGAQVTIPVLFSNNRYLDHPRKLFPKLQFHGRGYLTNLVHRQYMRRYLASSEGSYDLFHPTYYDSYFLRYIGHTPYVVTIHDMTHELFPQMFRDAAETSEKKRRLVEGAAKIIAVSENTKLDLVRLFGTPEERIAVVHHASSLQGPEQDEPRADNYLLYVGERAIYKNFRFMVEALAQTLEERDLTLLCVGGGELTPQERTLIGRLGLEGRVSQLGGIDDETLASLYSRALLFIYPSLYEGFGIPMLEAFACGCPVAASSTSSLPDVGGDAALYFDPKDAGSMRSAVESVLDDSSLRSELAERGRARGARFSWDEAARQTYRVYESVV